MAEGESLWDVYQVSAYLKVPVATLYGWRTKNYGPPASRVGRHLRYNPQDVKDWFDNLHHDLIDR